MTAISYETASRRFAARIGEPFTVVPFDEGKDRGKCRIHPHLTRLPGGRLVLTANIDGDIGGAELLAYASDDSGQTWREYAGWPKLGGAFADLGGGAALLAHAGGLFATEQRGVFKMPVCRSADGGLTWGPWEPARVELPLVSEEPWDRYDPPAWFLERDLGGITGRQWLAKWQKPRPSPAEQELRRQFGGRTVSTCLMQVVPLGNRRLLAFLYFSPTHGAPAVTVCLGSEDGGGSWSHRSTPGPFDERFRTHGYLRHALDGLCEPCCTRLATGELFLVMRLGSHHPLYATVSRDEGRTWAPPADQRPGCYYAGWPARPLAVHGILPTVLTLADGTLALCTGRPDATLSFSFDNGDHWPCTMRFLEDNKPEEQGTYNNSLVQVSPRRLLYVYDDGGYHPLPPERTGPRRIVAHCIDLEACQAVRSP